MRPFIVGSQTTTLLLWIVLVVASFMIAEAFIIVVRFNNDYQYQTKRWHRSYNCHNPFTTCSRLSQTSSDFNDELSSTSSSSTSIGDVVQGLHGGKYQFQDPGGMSYEGQQFAEMGYSSSGTEEEDEMNNYDNDPLPNWAVQLQKPISSTDSNYPQLLLDEHHHSSGKKGGTIQIRNEERSWEKYYAFVVVGEEENNDEDDDVVGLETSEDAAIMSSHPLFTIEPHVGMLAPRGGSNEFSDWATISITMADTNTTNHQPSGKLSYWLVVGTEEEKWIYKLVW